MIAINRWFRQTANGLHSGITTVRDAVHWVLHLYKMAQNGSEKVNATLFLLKFALTRLHIGGFDKEDTSICLQGIEYVVSLRSAEIYILEELYTHHFYDRLASFIPTCGWIVLDIGANVGMFTMQQANRGARVYAFEPNPDCYRRLSRAVIANGLTDTVEVFHRAVGSATGVGRLLVPNGWTPSGHVVPIGASDHDAAAPESTIGITSLDHVAPSLNAARIDLLKIDVEGTEADVLRGATHTLGIVERVIIEYHTLNLLEQVTVLLRDHDFSPVLRVDAIPGGNVGLLYAQKRASGA